MNRRHRALQIFGQAFDMLPEDGDEFLDRACGNDGLMRAKVDALLMLAPPPPIRDPGGTKTYVV